MPDDGISKLFDTLPPGVTDRPNGSPYYPTKVIDLIGIRERKYIDHTATHQNRGLASISTRNSSVTRMVCFGDEVATQAN
jgi:hypothetical protein